MVGDIYEAKYSDKKGVHFHSVGVVTDEAGNYLTLETLDHIAAHYQKIWTISMNRAKPQNGVTFIGHKNDHPEYFL